jgi:hypothetical protein
VVTLFSVELIGSLTIQVRFSQEQGYSLEKISTLISLVKAILEASTGTSLSSNHSSKSHGTFLVTLASHIGPPFCSSINSEGVPSFQINGLDAMSGHSLQKAKIHCTLTNLVKMKDKYSISVSTG